MLATVASLGMTNALEGRMSHRANGNYQEHARLAVDTLQGWYNTTTGLWETTGWWNGANCLTVLGDLAAVDPSFLNASASVFNNTWTQAPNYKPNAAQRTVNLNVQTANLGTQHSVSTDAFPDFTNAMYDDEGWWALAWIQAFDVTGDQRYLDTAVHIFTDMTTGWGATCGGLWWNKQHTENGAIENELFISVAAHLARRVPEQADTLQDWALKAWQWFSDSGLINDQHTINNGLDLSTCKNDQDTVWSYNQGVILGALVELSQLQSDQSYLSTARDIALGGIHALSNSDGVLQEPCEPDCGADGPQFKGVFMRNLIRLHQAAPDREIESFIRRNADSSWDRDRDEDNRLGLRWSGPYADADASTQGSACDALIAAAALNQTRK
ncbi:Six-hairpin glycosidase [Aspergillus campestris IBT 28561]|uniref:Six-hairpin glycosidase n=1 Tax=Aspergillus campestris (strain IBT 28561) TaxID=1392248 RepID=A0A2I1CS36_ASPC2|nr:Six-hairpin glycosidase [Aspergillus campestris IBT 28561]PKY00425.1 Six-hairpin glycosidase [Aspergillus campestris IBT 28561]